MKKILIIADGKIAKIFINTLLEKYFSNNYYVIVSNDSEILELEMPSAFKIHNFDATSESKLAKVLSSDLHDIVIIKPDLSESVEIYEIIRKITHNTMITITCESKKDVSAEMLKDPYLNTISHNFIVASKLIEKMPNIPLTAKGIGLNKGEIMQINIPFGSAYSYMNIGAISQKNWKIIGIYRKNDLILAKPSLILQPNDSLLVAGSPKVLNNIYKKINNKEGNFPAPFGIDIYVYVDFRNSTPSEIDDIIGDALWLHKKIRNEDLIINILNPSDIDKLREIKALAQNNIKIKIDYSKKRISQKIEEDSSKKIGLIIVSHNELKTMAQRRILYKTNSPILKVGKKTRLSEVVNTLVLLSHQSNYIQNISYTMMDIASQLNYDIKLFEFEIDDDYNTSLISYYNDISKIFNKKLSLEQTNSKNPILWLLNTNEKLLQFIPFEIGLIRKSRFWFLTKSMDSISLNINNNPQILIPFQ